MTVEERIKQQRDQRLIQLGYCTRVYKPNAFNTDYEADNDSEEAATPLQGATDREYPYYDAEMDQYFYLVADEVTDEQFERILAIGGDRVVESSNKLANIITVMGWLCCIILIIAGLVLATLTGYSSSFNFSIFGGCFGGGIGCLLSFLWFAEVLKLLQRIHDKL